MNGSGCKNCPVPMCVTLHYRGSVCMSQRAKLGLGDPQTNADRIRVMTDDELAEFLCGVNGCYQENCPGAELCEFGGGLANGLKKWLQQPAEEVHADG